MLIDGIELTQFLKPLTMLPNIVYVGAGSNRKASETRISDNTLQLSTKFHMTR